MNFAGALRSSTKRFAGCGYEVVYLFSSNHFYLVIHVSSEELVCIFVSNKVQNFEKRVKKIYHGSHTVILRDLCNAINIYLAKI